MGREYRSIILSKSEVDEAVVDHLCRIADRSNIDSIIVSFAPAPRCVVTLLNPALDGRSVVRLEESEFIEVLIAFIRQKGHPLPRRGAKRLSEIDGELALMIEMDWF